MKWFTVFTGILGLSLVAFWALFQVAPAPKYDNQPIPVYDATGEMLKAIHAGDRANVPVTGVESSIAPVYDATGAMLDAINPDKTADYEKVIAQLKDALSKSEAPEAKQQLAGWKVIKNAMPNPDGSIVYIHIISPVVKDADYSIMNNIYTAVKDPAAAKAVFDMYRGAMKQALFVIQGPLVNDLSK